MKPTESQNKQNDKLPKRYDFWARLPLSLIGLLIALLPAPYFLINAMRLERLIDVHLIGVEFTVATFSFLGSYLCLRALIPKRWDALLWCPLLALGFFLVNSAICIFVGCAASLSNM